MKRIKREIALLLSVSSLLLCACGGTSVVEPTPEPVVFSNDPESISAASESVVMLNCYDKNGELSCTGSAFQCFEEGIYVTNYHVVNGIDKIQGCTEKKLYFDIDEIIAADPDRDIAILKTAADPGVAVLPDGDSDAIIKGENVVAIGSPKGFLNTVSKGTYSGVTEFDDGQKLLQFNASISSGSSGGALFNDNGEVIGITSSQYTEGDDLNFAVPIGDVKEVWDNKENYVVDNIDATIKVGDFVEFGEYPENQKIEWIVLDENEGNYLLTSNSTLEWKPYNEKLVAINWAKCTLREWLNNEFYEQSFSKDEKVTIIKTQLTDEKKGFSSTYDFEPTEDYVFLLSQNEFIEYFVNGPFAGYRIADDYGWWLRSPGLYSNTAAYVNDQGELNYEGSYVYFPYNGIRPSIWTSGEYLEIIQSNNDKS